jgi:uncharacterized LabA/DUF88 family protein
MITIIYIDSANLHKSSLGLGYNINYKKFIGWLRQKYSADKVYVFMGKISGHEDKYRKIIDLGYKIIFKETITGLKGKIKGNCDAEIVLKICQDFYNNKTDKYIVITSDGDFACLVNFLLESKSNILILSPNRNKCSVLLKKTGSKITDLNDHYHKFSEIKKIAPR